VHVDLLERLGGGESVRVEVASDGGIAEFLDGAAGAAVDEDGAVGRLVEDVRALAAVGLGGDGEADGAAG